MPTVLRTGGKQYLVSQGQVLAVEKLSAKPKEKVEFLDKFSNQKIEATVIEHFKGPKIRAIKFKRRKRYRRKLGHRQPYTKIKIVKILPIGKVKRSTEMVKKVASQKPVKKK